MTANRKPTGWALLTALLSIAFAVLALAAVIHGAAERCLPE